MKYKTPTLKQKVAQYEEFLHKINTMIVCCDSKSLQKLINNADSWSYSFRRGNGELSEKEQQELVNQAFWKLNNIE
jgi:hypothetical protein